MAAHYPDDLALQISCRDKAAIAHTLLDIVNNVLDMSKLESSAIDLEQRSFSLSATLQEVSAVIEPQAAERSIGTKPHRSPLSNVRLIGSPNHLQRILQPGRQCRKIWPQRRLCPAGQPGPFPAKAV